MKKTSIIGMLSLALLAGVSFTSCEDMMEVDTGDKMYTNANDTLYSYLGIMRCMQDVAERQVILGEIRGDLVASTEFTTDTLFAISNFEDPKDGSCSMLQISDYYNIINNCNFYITNADTGAVKANVQYMLPEYAQVQSVRAWAYLQLVKNYGSVPFITKPVNSLDVIKEFDYYGNQATKENLVDLLIAEGLDKYVKTRYPSYDKYGNGATDISAQLCFIPVGLVLGDLYLLRGDGKSDFEKAARYYYEYLRDNSLYVRANYGFAYPSSTATSGYNFTGSGLLNYAKQYSYAPGNEVISVIPGAANKGFGTMLTRVADIFGYNPTSSQSSKEETSEDSEETTVTTSGAISVSPTYKRQFSPSRAYEGVNEAQHYVHYEVNGSSEVRVDYTCGDSRMAVFSDDYTDRETGNPFTLCAKAASASEFYYTIPIYRVSLVWLRLAEAINRYGYPEFAFAILKDGLNQENLPVVKETKKRVPRVDPVTGDPVINPETGKQYIDEVITRKLEPNSLLGALYYVKDSLRVEAFNQFLDFRNSVWANNIGIHGRGCGYGYSTSTMKNSCITWDTPSTNITGWRDSIYYDYDTLLYVGLRDVATPTMDDTINVIENLIVDELALETAFEGNRFTDLVRIAEHKNASGYDGTEWLANKIANRDLKADKNDPTSTVGERNEDLYNKLIQKDESGRHKYWYFAKPDWSVK